MNLTRTIRSLYRKLTCPATPAGCCTCGKPPYNWVYWGALTGEPIGDGYPSPQSVDWTECDPCHDRPNNGIATSPNVRSERWSDERVAEEWGTFLAGEER